MSMISARKKAVKDIENGKKTENNKIGENIKNNENGKYPETNLYISSMNLISYHFSKKICIGVI